MQINQPYKSLLRTFAEPFIKPLYLLVGKALFASPTWLHIRKHCFNFTGIPDLSLHDQIREQSKLLYHLNKAYLTYAEFKHRNLSSREWQKVHWDDYGANYYFGRANAILDQNFILNFENGTKNTDSVIEIGCGGFAVTKILARKHPEIVFNTCDISEGSSQIYEKDIRANFKNIKFTKCSIFENLKMLEQTPFFTPMTYLCISMKVISKSFLIF